MIVSMGDADIPELTEPERAGWKALGSSYRALAEAAAKGDLTEEDVGATLAQTGQIELDPARFTDALHVPEDAGAYAEALEGLLRRIPDGWGRWISCDAGWYPLIVDLDAAMAAIWPTYVVQQVKEKFGSLRFYFDAEGLPLEDAQASATGCVAPRRGGTFTTDLRAVRGRRGALQAAGLAEDSVRGLPQSGAQPWLRAGCGLTFSVRRRLLVLVRGEGRCGDRWS